MLLVLLPLLLRGNGQSTLNQVASTFLGPSEEDASYRTSVCPDGTFAVAEWNTKKNSNRVTILRHGLQSKEFVAIPSVKAAIGCDSNNRILVATKDKLITLEFDGYSGSVVRSDTPLTAGIRPERLQTSPSGDIYLLGSVDGLKPVIARLSPSGALLQTFDAIPSSKGSLGWDAVQSSLLFVPEEQFEFWRLGKDLSTVSVCRPKSDFRSDPDQFANGISVSDRVLRAVWLPNGSIVVHILGQSLASGVLRQAPQLHVIDSSRSFHAIPNSEVPGILAGASADGLLYFSAIGTADGIRIFKMKLAMP